MSKNPKSPENSNQTKEVTKTKIFAIGFIPIIIIMGLLLIEYIWFEEINNQILNDEVNVNEIKKFVLRYENQFTPDQVNATKYEIISPEIKSEVSLILQKTQWQISISIMILFIVGIIFAISNSRVLPKKYSQSDIVKPDFWFKTGSTISSSISGSVSAVVGIVGGMTLLTPEIIGGYLIAGLQTLLLCIILGIGSHAISSEIVKGESTNGMYKINSYVAANWEATTSIQFVTLIVGIILIVLQVVTL